MPYYRIFIFHFDILFAYSLGFLVYEWGIEPLLFWSWSSYSIDEIAPK